MRAKGPIDLDKYGERWKRQFAKLLRLAEKRNQLYYLLNLLNAWGAVARLSKRPSASSMDFNVEVNRLTQALIFDPVNRGLAIPPHHALFAVQVNLEAKAFYATVRNFANIRLGKRVHIEPWRKPDFAGKGLSTTKILRNLASELRAAGLKALSNELTRTHLTKVAPIRHAVAHGNFRLPSDETGGKWVFGEYVGSFPYIYVKTTRMRESEFLDILRRFFSFRMAFIGAFDDAKANLKNKRFAFKASNQMKRSEKLDCTFDNGTISLIYRGTPIW